jgi:putative ABC transport system substrate-binding protein
LRLVHALRQGLRELGYVEGQNIAIEFRWAEGKYDRLPGLAAELVRLKVNVIVALTPPAVQAAKQATETIPIVMTAVADPVAMGFVASLARPGRNITGLSSMQRELVGKRLELLKEVVPKVSRVALLGNPANPNYVSLATRRMRPGHWACDFNPWRHGARARSTLLSHRSPRQGPARSSSSGT